MIKGTINTLTVCISNVIRRAGNFVKNLRLNSRFTENLKCEKLSSTNENLKWKAATRLHFFFTAKRGNVRGSRFWTPIHLIPFLLPTEFPPPANWRQFSQRLRRLTLKFPSGWVCQPNCCLLVPWNQILIWYCISSRTKRWMILWPCSVFVAAFDRAPLAASLSRYTTHWLCFM